MASLKLVSLELIIAATIALSPGCQKTPEPGTPGMKRVVLESGHFLEDCIKFIEEVEVVSEDDESGFSMLYHCNKDGMLHGKAIGRNKAGAKAFEDDYRHGGFHGKRLAWHPNGRLFADDTYVHDRRQGVSRMWFADGTPHHEYHFHKGDLHGLQRTYGVDGRLLKADNYEYGLPVVEDGTPVVESEWGNPHGSCESLKSYKKVKARWAGRDGSETVTYCEEGEPHGRFVAWHPNGEKWFEGGFHEGLTHGERLTWYSTGALQAEEHWDKGRPTGVRRMYFEDGVLSQRITYENGDIKEWVQYNPDGTIRFKVPGDR